MYQIFVKTLQGKLVTVDVEDQTTIGQVKSIALKKQGYSVSPDHVRLSCLHRRYRLSEGETITACGVEREQTLQMYWRGPVSKPVTDYNPNPNPNHKASSVTHYKVKVLDVPEPHA